jgi:FdhE protein
LLLVPHASSVRHFIDAASPVLAGSRDRLSYHRLAQKGIPGLPTAWSRGVTSWKERIDRTTELGSRNPWARQVLTFYRRVLEFQKTLSEEFEAQHGPTSFAATRLLGALDLHQSARHLLALVEVVSEAGPPTLAQYANRLRSQPLDQSHRLLERWLHTPDLSDSGSAFFARVLLQPQAERLAREAEVSQHSSAEKLCPVCGSRPQLAVIRPEGDGGKRSLLCSLCMSEWEFRRILCPACGEEDHKKLPRYSAEGMSAVRVEACDSCQHYLKSVDLTQDGHAVPVVDEIASAPLDLWTAEHDYRKIQLNIVGF